ncbi:MAG TPA: cytochrome P460 family protein [Rhizomicrobium sp.]|nr:cytochrome P460 family protein [Rhizomicrobium sp.]
MKHLSKILCALLLAPCAVLAQDANRMAVPDDYRQWVFLTSSLDLNYSTAAAPSHHMLDNVFVNPEAYKAFLKTGTWPDKTVLVKENRMAESAGTLSKSGQFQTGVMDLEIHVKDEARFPGKWAFFVSSDGKAAGTLMPQSASCYSCHRDHAAVDTTFVQFYPIMLGIAKDKGTLSAGYLKDSAAKP